MTTAIGTPADPSTPPDVAPEPPRFTRAIGLRSAIAVNMTQMCGIGPFVTMPLMIDAMGGPQAMFGWFLGAALAMADGLVWAELGAAMPGAGGTYVYLREAFQYRSGRLMPFLFIWTMMIAIPLIMAGGVIGIVGYLGYYFPNLRVNVVRAISIGSVALVVAILYRDVRALAKLANLLFVIMLITVGAMIAASLSHFSPSRAFTFPAGAFGPNGKFWAGLSAGLIYATYDYMGYNTTAYMGEELCEPGRVIPRSIIYSVLAMMVIYLCMNIGVMGVLPWREAAGSTSIGSLLMERTWGKPAAQVFTALIIITGFASVLMGLLGASRVPYNAARDKLFFPVFGRLHPRLKFPYVALLVMGVATAIGSFFALDDVINTLTATIVLVQAVPQIAALIILRRRQPNLRRPYRMFLYPLPSLIALAGWLFIYSRSGKWMIVISLVWLGVGCIAFLIWAKFERTWPFGPKEIREEYLEVQSARVHD